MFVKLLCLLVFSFLISFQNTHLLWFHLVQNIGKSERHCFGSSQWKGIHTPHATHTRACMCFKCVTIKQSSEPFECQWGWEKEWYPRGPCWLRLWTVSQASSLSPACSTLHSPRLFSLSQSDWQWFRSPVLSSPWANHSAFLVQSRRINRPLGKPDLPPLCPMPDAGRTGGASCLCSELQCNGKDGVALPLASPCAPR